MLQSDKNARAIALTVSTQPNRDAVEDQVQDWLFQLGLTETESLCAIAVARITSSADMQARIEGWLYLYGVQEDHGNNS